MPLVTHITLDTATWAALALVLTVVGAALSWVAWRRRGVAAGLRGLAWTLVPVAAWLTGTLRLTVNIINDILDWAARLVFSPTVWLGIIVAGVVVVLWGVSGVMRARGIGTRRDSGQRKQAPVQATAPARAVRRKPAKAAKPAKPAKDDIDDMDDIEAILKKHGI